MLIDFFREPVHHQVNFVVANVAKDRVFIIVKIKTKSCKGALWVSTGNMVVMITSTRPVAIEAGESSVGRQILGAAEPLTPSSQHVTFKAELGQKLRQYGDIKGKTNRLKVVWVNKLLSSPR